MCHGQIVTLEASTGGSPVGLSNSSSPQPEKGEKEPLEGQELDVCTTKGVNEDMALYITIGTRFDRGILNDFHLTKELVSQNVVRF